MRALRLPCAAVALAALITSCGTGQGAAHRVTLGFSAWPGWFPWQVAKEAGLFRQNGLDVDLRFYGNYTKSLTALTNGDLDANSQTLNDTLVSVADGSRETIVLVNDNSTGNDQIIARPGITSIAALRGKTVAAEDGTVDHYLLMLALKQAGLGPKDVRFQAMPTAAAAEELVRGKVDAVGVFAPFTTTALKLPGSHALSTSRDFPGAIPDHLVVSSAFLADHPRQVQALVKTWFDTRRWIAAHRAAAVRIMARRAGVSEADYAGYDAGTTIFTLQQNIDAFRPGQGDTRLPYRADLISSFLYNSGLIQLRPPLDGLFEPRFVNAMRAG